MKPKFHAEVDLSREEVEEILTKHLEQQTKQRVVKSRPRLASCYREASDIRDPGSYHPVFKGYRLTLKKD
jgi:hypothetical protein